MVQLSIRSFLLHLSYLCVIGTHNWNWTQTLLMILLEAKCQDKEISPSKSLWFLRSNLMQIFFSFK